MKKVFLIIILVCFFHVNYAQESQNGQIKVSVSGIPLIDWNNGYYGFVIKPGFEYFITSHLSVQNDFFFNTQTGYFLNDVNARTNTFGFIPSLRYCHFFNDKWMVFGQAGVGFGVTIYKPLEDEPDPFKVERLNAGVVVYSAGVGVGYRFSNRVEIELLVPYIVVDNITNSSNASILFNGIGPTIGIKISLNKNHQ